MPKPLRCLTLACWIAAAAFDLYLVLRLFHLIDRYSVNLLYWDNFNYYFVLAGRWNFWQRFTAQIGPHREGAGMLLSSVIAPLSHWNMRAEAFAIGAILCPAAIVCLWMKSRAFGRLAWYDLLVIPGLILSPIQWETWTVTVNSSHGVLPLLLIMLYCLSWTIPRPGVRIAAVLCINFLATFTGFGFFLGIVTPIVFAFTRNKTGLLISLASLGLFFVHYHFDPANPNFRWVPPSFVDQLKAVALGFSHTVNFLVLPWVFPLGFTLLAALLFAAARNVRGLIKADAKSIIIVSCISFTLLFVIAAVDGRSSFGIWCLMPSRYYPLFVPAFLGGYLAIASMPKRPIKCALVAIAVLIALSTSLRVNRDDRTAMEEMRMKKQTWITAYQSTHDLDAADRAAGRPIYPIPRPADLPGKIDYLRQHQLNFFSP